jgi:hypothetical protein
MRKNLKINFEGYENVETNYSQASQDIFVLSCLNGKKNGTFLDLGCHEPKYINNTYLLETKFGWKGTSIDIEEKYTKLYENFRTCNVLTEDCTKVDYKKIISMYETNHIDYLSLDLEPASITFECLKSIPLGEIEFSVITYEHDFYRFGDTYRRLSREVLESYGYKRICSDVKDNGFSYEDWYYNPKYVNYENIKLIESFDKSWEECLYEK